MIRLWVVVAIVCALAGYAVADLASDNIKAGIDWVAAERCW